MRILIIGCGYLGLPLGARLAAAGHDVSGMRRSESARSELESIGIKLIPCDITEPTQLARIEPHFDAVINMVSSTRGGLEEYRRVYLQGTQNLLAWLRPSSPAKYLYTSSTSVYGQQDGSWVTEESPTLPDNASSQILVETERQLSLAHSTSGFPSIIVRVGGIYGPGRGHLFKQFLRGEATIREDGSNYINSIHLEDAVGAVVHLLEHGRPGEVYNAVDNEPVTQLEFFQWLSGTLGGPLPPSAAADPNRKRGLTNKRVSNAKLRSTGYHFTYPTFREGYGAEIKRSAAA